jgi:hypothetical protein
MQNYPNPFNPVTRITFAIPVESFASVIIYDILGKEITKLSDNQFYTAGFHNVILDANILSLASGVYFYRLIATAEEKLIATDVKRMVLIK